MRFEHLIEINDPLNPLLDPLSRAQLWRGLVRRAEHPCEFVLGLDGAQIHARIEDGIETELARTLDFGGVLINEVPTWRADQMPYGGLRDSGNTREGPAYSVREMTEERLIILNG